MIDEGQKPIPSSNGEDSSICLEGYINLTKNSKKRFRNSSPFVSKKFATRLVSDVRLPLPIRKVTDIEIFSAIIHF